MGVKKLLDLPDEFKLGRRVFGFMDHFDHYVSTDRWTSITPDSGSVAVGDAMGGVLTLTPSDGTVAANDQAIVHTTNELFLFDDERPIIAEAFLQFTEENVDEANIAFGLMSGVAADAMLDAGAGPAADDSSALIYKVAGENLWRAESSAGDDSANQLITESDAVPGGSDFTRLRVEVHSGGRAGTVDVVFFVDELQLQENRKSGTPSTRLIKHKEVDISSASEMSVVMTAKNGGTDNQLLLAKYVAAYQLY